MNRILVTGHTGFIGSHVLKELRKHYPQGQFLCLSRRCKGHSDPKISETSVDFLQANLQWKDEVMRFMPDVVIHCAGTVSSHLIEATSQNVLMTAVLLRAFGDCPGRIRFIHIGSGAEYGEISPTPRGVSEQSCPNPNGFYGITKLAATLMVLSCHERSRIEPVVLRPFNPIGLGMSRSTLIGKLTRILSDPVSRAKPEILLGPLDAHRDFVDVRDVARAVVSAARSQSAVGQVFNIGRGEAVRVRALVTEILQAAKYPGRVIESLAGSERSRGVSWQKADIRKAGKMLDWMPKVEWVDTTRRLAAVGSK